jgi:hypothetical protein
MDDDGAAETGLNWVLNPGEVLVSHVISLEKLLFVFFLCLLCLILSCMLLFFSSSLRLILQVKPDGELEIALHSTALMATLQCIEYLDVDLRAIESTISVVKFPGAAEFV